jgi:hypothetical protein
VRWLDAPCRVGGGHASVSNIVGGIMDRLVSCNQGHRTLHLLLPRASLSTATRACACTLATLHTDTGTLLVLQRSRKTRRRDRTVVVLSLASTASLGHRVRRPLSARPSHSDMASMPIFSSNADRAWCGHDVGGGGGHCTTR